MACLQALIPAASQLRQTERHSNTLWTHHAHDIDGCRLGEDQ
jgi:hypothetical protein